MEKTKIMFWCFETHCRWVVLCGSLTYTGCPRVNWQNKNFPSHLSVFSVTTNIKAPCRWVCWKCLHINRVSQSLLTVHCILILQVLTCLITLYIFGAILIHWISGRNLIFMSVLIYFSFLQTYNQDFRSYTIEPFYESLPSHIRDLNPRLNLVFSWEGFDGVGTYW